MQTTTRRGLKKPETTDDPDDLRIAVVDNADLLDDAPIFGSGSLASLPTSTPGSPGIPGRSYLATDQTPKQLWLDHGTGWLKIYPTDALTAGSVDVADLATATLNHFLRLDSPGDRRVKWGSSTTPGFGDGTTITGNIAHGEAATPQFAVINAHDIATLSAINSAVAVSITGLDATNISYRANIVNNSGSNNATALSWLAIF